MFVTVCQLIYLQGDTLCKECFFYAFEEEIHKTIIDAKLFKRDDRIALGASGGKGRNYLFYIGTDLIIML